MKKWYFLYSAVLSFIIYLILGKGQLGERIMCSIILGLPAGLSFFAFAEIKRRMENGIDILATLETDEEKLKAHLLFNFQHLGIEANLKEVNDALRNYPQWNLSEWVVFRAWYKAQIDHMMKYPKIYGLKFKETGEPYNPENDPLYDPDAPDWEQFDRPNYDDDDDDDYDINDNSSNLGKSAEEGFMLGLGFGVGSELFDDNK